MRGARPRGGDAHAQLAGELCMRGRHERGHLFVARLNEFDLSLRAIERAEHAVDAVAGISEDAAHAPRVKTLDNKVSDCLAHCLLPERMHRRWSAGHLLRYR